MNSFLEKLLTDLPESKQWLIFDGLNYQNELKLYELILQLEQDVLRPRLQLKGKDDETYKFFMLLKNAVYQAAEAEYIIKRLREETYSTNEFAKHLLAENAKLFTRLSEYETIEELSKRGMLEANMDRVRNKMKTNYEQTKKDAV